MTQYDSQLLKKVQAVDLKMAKYFVEFCNDNNLLCYFCGGGCIGAVRHKGFIPWDDDLDFFMPRRDYEKLKDVWCDTNEYALLYPTEKYNDHNMFATLRDKNTTMIKPYQKDLDTVHGISVDIFPIDGYPDKPIERKLQVFWGLVYQLFCSQVIPENHGVISTIAARIALGVFKGRKIRYKIWKKAEKEMTKYRIEDCENITEICAGPGYFKNKYPKQIFASAVFMDFEDTKMPVPVKYDQYLRIVFGDYMKLPPEDKRVPQHDAIVLDPEKSYTNYKGQFYCTGN
ncbi:MAG: LicD family protein [Clostridiales bacterium]|nr:LicD family protein [Clostridiales bacterium]